MKTLMLVTLLLAHIDLLPCATLTFSSYPRSVILPHQAEDVLYSELQLINGNILGLSSKTGSSFPVKTDLFRRPRALAIAVVSGIDDLSLGGPKFHVHVDNEEAPILEKNVFDNVHSHIQVSRWGVTSSPATEFTATTEELPLIRTQSHFLRQELIHLYHLADSLVGERSRGDLVSHSPEVIEVRISGLSQINATSPEFLIAVEDVHAALTTLKSAVGDIFAGDVVMEVLCIDGQRGDWRKTKRSVGTPAGVQHLRSMYTVSKFTSSNYPAAFLVILGTSILFAVIVLSACVSVVSEDSLQSRSPHRYFFRLKLD